MGLAVPSDAINPVAFSPPTGPQPTTFFEEGPRSALQKMPWLDFRIGSFLTDRAVYACRSMSASLRKRRLAAISTSTPTRTIARLFKYVMHTLSSEISESIGGRVPFLGPVPDQNVTKNCG
jgi:hypothetical protein